MSMAERMCAVAARQIDRRRAERAVRELLAACGLEAEPTMAQTPALVAEALGAGGGGLPRRFGSREDGAQSARRD